MYLILCASYIQFVSYFPSYKLLFISLFHTLSLVSVHFDQWDTAIHVHANQKPCPQRAKSTLMQCQAKHIEVWVDVLTIRTNQERLSVRLMAAVIAKPASPAFTGSTTDTRMAVPNTTMLLMKSILMASHLFMICRATAWLWSKSYAWSCSWNLVCFLA